MQICGQLCANTLLKSTSFSRMIAPVRRAVFTNLWKTGNHISSVTWPAQSLDINVIENVWKVIKLHVQKYLSAIKSRQDLAMSVLTA